MIEPFAFAARSRAFWSAADFFMKRVKQSIFSYKQEIMLTYYHALLRYYNS